MEGLRALLFGGGEAVPEARYVETFGMQRECSIPQFEGTFDEDAAERYLHFLDVDNMSACSFCSCSLEKTFFEDRSLSDGPLAAAKRWLPLRTHRARAAFDFAVAQLLNQEVPPRVDTRNRSLLWGLSALDLPRYAAQWNDVEAVRILIHHTKEHMRPWLNTLVRLKDSKTMHSPLGLADLHFREHKGSALFDMLTDLNNDVAHFGCAVGTDAPEPRARA